MTAVIFDVVPARISATVAGAYLLFIHVAGDAIALPLVGTLSDRFGLDRAVLLLPALVIVGGLIFSQMVTLFVTPVIYLWLEWFQEHVLDRVPFLRSAHFHEHDFGQRAKPATQLEPVGAE